MALIMTISSCTEKIDIDFEDAEQILVVEGSITDIDTTHWVKLSYTQNVLGSDQIDYTVESGATVTLFENETLIDTLEFNADNERFETDKFGTIGNKYSIKIITEDGTNYYSEDEEMRRKVPIDTIWSEFVEGSSFQEDAYTVFIETLEPEGLGDNYQWKIYVNDEFLSNPEDILYAQDDLVDGNVINEWDIFDMDEEEYDEYALKGSDPNSVNVRIEQASINRSYREFLHLIDEQVNGAGNLFSPPPAEIRGNIRKDVAKLERAQGYFFTASIAEIEIDVKR